MIRGKIDFAVLVILFVVICLVPSSFMPNTVVRAIPNSPYEGTGNTIDVQEFARNESATFTNGAYNTAFTYDAGWFPSGYRGYRLYSQVLEVSRSTDPVPNGDFENVTGFNETWNLNSTGLIDDIYNVTGGNPSFCMDVKLPYGRINKQAIATIENVFNYTSAFDPDESWLYFDIQFSGDVTQQDWLVLTVEIQDEGGQTKGYWQDNLADYHEPVWNTHRFETTPVNGLVRILITLEKITSMNEWIQGHIYFDNFRYEIKSLVKPSEAALSLNGTPFSDTISNQGELNIYADPSQKEEVDWANCWGTSQLFEFNSPFENLSFHYSYAMFVKQILPGAASTTFFAPVDETPIWQATYTVATGAPSGHTGYSFGLYLRSGWVRLNVSDSTGNVDHTYNETTLFVKLDDGVSIIGETYSVFATSLNYVLSVIPQKGPSTMGPWTDVATSGYLVKDEYLRVKAQLGSIGPSNNFANVSIFYPNGSLWQSANSTNGVTIDDATDSLTSTAWQIESVSEADIGQDWIITVSFDNQTQCGMRQASFIIVVATRYSEISPSQHSQHIWGEPIFVNVSWQNDETNSYITDANASIRYIDRFTQTRIVDMIPNNKGSYSLDLSTNLMSPDINAEFYVELFHYGYVNASYNEGTHITFTINLINDLDLIMIRPTQVTGENQYTGQTSRSQGYWSQVKFLDPYRSAYVLNESSFWPLVYVDYDYYEDTGLGFGSPVSSYHFDHNTTDRTFNQIDLSYSVGVQAVKYEVSMQIGGASWDFVQIDFTIIIIIVDHATNLDLVQTSIDYPPAGYGSGWTVFNPVSDNYEVHLYWNEVLNVTVFFENTSTSIGIEGATVNILVQETNLYPLSSIVGAPGFYTYDLNSSSLDPGPNPLFVNATYPDHANQLILITLFLEPRLTELSRNHTGSTYVTPWGTDFILSFTFVDGVTGTPVPLRDASVDVVYDGLNGNYSALNNGDGTYTITFNGQDLEATYYLTIIFTKDNYQSKSQYYEFTIRKIWAQAFGVVIPTSIPWGDLVNITLTYDNLDNGEGIIGAIISLFWQDNKPEDYWITDNFDGTYTVTLNTTKVPTGTQNFILQLNLTKAHYQTAQATVSFQVRDIQTILYIIDAQPGTSIPWGDTLTLFLQFIDTDHIPNLQITSADITCDWDAFYWSVTPFNISHNAFLLVIQTRSRLEGSYEVNIFANSPHYRDSINRYNFVIRIIRTGSTATPQYIPSHPLGANLNITLHYFDLDHASIGLPFAELTSDWNGTYTIYELGDGWYIIELNTTQHMKGTHNLMISISLLPHYENQSIPVTIVITAIPIQVTILEPPTGQLTVDYNTLITITVNITDYQGAPINDANVTYQWDGRSPIPMVLIGNGIYTVSFLADADVLFNHPITITATNETRYSPGISSILLYILPIDTALNPVVTSYYETIIGEPFEISVNFTTVNGLPIDGAIVTFAWAENRTGLLLNVGPGIYNITLDSSGLGTGEFSIYISASKTTMREKTIILTVRIRKIPTQIVGLASSIQVPIGGLFNIFVTFLDTHNNVYITDAELFITITGLAISEVPLTNHHNGTYSITDLVAPLFQGTHTIQIEASGSDTYASASVQATLIVQPNEGLSSFMTLVAIGAILGIILLAALFAYVRVFSVPWMVRKMRKMSKSIGKGDVPTLSKMDLSRISNRSDLMADIVKPYYGTIGIPSVEGVLPVEIDWREREAEDQAIWSELKSFPYIEYEQKLELFQQMKQIAPSERVWFLDDLKKQMADGTRFARKPKEPKLSEELEQELQQRLATFPALSDTEKVRISAQLRKLPKEEWDEIFQTLAIAGAPQVLTMEEELGPDEFPSLTPEEQERILEEIKDLSEEEKRKVLSTIREKQMKKTPKGEVVKGKKKFIIDDKKNGN